ncbi:VWA domain-containing protein [Synechococcus sp. MU1625]|uniref:VWA domain-containing protein n=1 Tax=Synechococcus sp. MU1625 TaxID=2508347 RepID=UPI001CF91A9E|nr:VWA domain-containing protein [Synechococcus sp. MU1625]MCB4398432.1 VWA domain-containing protein [Synechococcus sp. MU1625]
MIRLSQKQGIAQARKETGFTVPELLVGVIAGTLIIGAASTGLRTSQTLISESHGKATLRQNTTNGLRLMRSEIERSMNILVARTEEVQEGEEDTDLTQYNDIINNCKALPRAAGFNPVFGINMVELDDPVIYGVGLSRDGRGYALLRCGSPLNMDGTYLSSEDNKTDTSMANEQVKSEIFISRILDDIGTIPCKEDDLAEDEQCPERKTLSNILSQTSFAFTGSKSPARVSQEPALRIQTDINTKLVKFIDPYELDDNKSDAYKISASFLENTNGVKSQTKQDLYFSAFARADKRVRFGYNATDSGEGSGYPGGAFFQNITSRNLRFILDGSGSMSACVAWSGEYGNTRRRFYDPERGYFRTTRICSFTRMEALQHEMIDIISNLPDYTKIGLASFSTSGYRNNKVWEDSRNELVELGPSNSETRQSAIRFVNSLSSSDPKYWGGTMPWSTLDAAFSDRVTDTIYFLSDGQPNKDRNGTTWSSNDYVSVADHYAALNVSRVGDGDKPIKLNTTSVGLNSEWMQLLSSKTSGEYIRVDDI